MRHRPQLTSPKLLDGNLLHAADFWTWSSGYDERNRLRDGVIWPELQKVQSSSSGPSLIFGGDALYDSPPQMAQISAGQR